MATRYQVSLAHQGCAHTGSVVWEERARTGLASPPRPIVVSLPRGFASVTTDDGSIEILCSGCAQTVAAATFTAASDFDQQAPADEGGPERDAHLDAGDEAPAAPATGGTLDMLLAEHPDVSPVRGDSIPHHLMDRLRHLASRLRNGAT